MTSRKIAAFVLCACWICLLMIGGVWAQEPEPTPTDTPTLVPTDTLTNTNTPTLIPTDTATDTATSTDTILPTDTPTNTATATAPETTPEVTDPPLVEGPTSTPTRTAVEPTGLPTWCYYWNFADGNGGFGLPAQIGAGEWVLGQGWKAQQVTLKSINRTLVQIERTFAPTILTNVDFAYVREEGEVDSEASGIVETLGIFINYVYPSTVDAQAADIFPFDGGSTFSWSDSVGVMATSVILESQPSWTNDSTATGSSTITAATFRGRGVNPFNAPDNCDLPPTATPTPTLTDTPTDTSTFTQTPTPIGTPGVNCSGDGVGLIGHYHNAAQSFTNEVLVRLDPLLNINWGLGSPETGVVSTDSFTVRWNGYLRPTYSGQHYFRFRVSDGIRMYILLNGEYQRILSKWVNATSPQYRVSDKVLLVANGCYPITIEYFDTNQEAVMEFSWSTSPLVDFTDMASPDWGVVPSVRVYPDGAQVSTPTPTMTPTPVVGTNCELNPAMTLPAFGISYSGEWTEAEIAAMLSAAHETGRALCQLGIGNGDIVSAFRTVFQGRNSNGQYRQIVFIADSSLRYCRTNKYPNDSESRIAEISCNPNLELSQYTVVHEFGHVLVKRTEVANLTCIDPETGLETQFSGSLYLSTLNYNPCSIAPSDRITVGFNSHVFGMRTFDLLGDETLEDWQRSEHRFDNGWGSPAQFNPPSGGGNYAIYQSEYLPTPTADGVSTVTPTPAPGYWFVPLIGPCENTNLVPPSSGQWRPTETAPVLATPQATVFPFQQNACNVPNEMADATLDTVEVEEAAADMFLNWVYWKNYPHDPGTFSTDAPRPTPSGFEDALWRGRSGALQCWPDGCPDDDQSGAERGVWMESTLQNLFDLMEWVA